MGDLLQRAKDDFEENGGTLSVDIVIALRAAGYDPDQLITAFDKESEDNGE